MSDDHTADRFLTIAHSVTHGETFGDPTYHPLPETGDFKTRIVRTRFGSARDHVIRVRCTSPVDVTLIAASIQAE
jgi:hypothetical protein